MDGCGMLRLYVEEPEAWVRAASGVVGAGAVIALREGPEHGSAAGREGITPERSLSLPTSSMAGRVAMRISRSTLGIIKRTTRSLPFRNCVAHKGQH